MKKTFETFHATINATSKHYEMSQNWFNKMIENLPEGYDWKKNPKAEGVYAITKNGKRVYIVDIIKKAGKVNNNPKDNVKKENKTNLQKKENVSRETSKGHKGQNDSYIVIYKNKDEKKETTNTSMTTCAEIKEFLKTISKRQIEYLKIYDSANNECRKSAWIV